MPKKITIEEFSNRAAKIHKNKYDYSCTEYVSMILKIKIICPKHGEFKQKAHDHIKGSGCKLCKSEKLTTGNLRRMNTLQFIKKSIEIHGDKYDYYKSNYINYRTKVKINCPTHGIWTQTPRGHLSGKGCPNCNESRGEKEIRILLKLKNINFITQKKFDRCVNPKTNKKLRFDFYLPDYNLCIEYDGEQHFNKLDFFGGTKGLLELQKRDIIKNKFCKKEKIDLLRISYKENIETVLIEHI